MKNASRRPTCNRLVGYFMCPHPLVTGDVYAGSGSSRLYAPPTTVKIPKPTERSDPESSERSSNELVADSISHLSIIPSGKSNLWAGAEDLYWKDLDSLDKRFPSISKRREDLVKKSDAVLMMKRSQKLLSNRFD